MKIDKSLLFETIASPAIASKIIPKINNPYVNVAIKGYRNKYMDTLRKGVTSPEDLKNRTNIQNNLAHISNQARSQNFALPEKREE